VSQLATGCRAALALLHGRYAQLVFNVAARTLERTAAEDVVQDVFLEVWRSAATFDGQRGGFRPWLFRLARWRTLNELRRRYRRPRTTQDADQELAELADDDPGPFDLAAAEERRRLVQTALRKLSPPERQAVALAFLEERTHPEVSAALDVPLGTTKTRIRSGLHRLRLYLAPSAASL